MKPTQKWNFYILIAALLGTLFGFLHTPFTLMFAELIQKLFMNGLKLLSVPMIFLSILSTMTRWNNLKEMGVLLKKIVTYTCLTTLLAATIGLLLFTFLHPRAEIPYHVDQMQSILPQGSYLSFLENIVPENFVSAFVENNVIGVVFIAITLSIAILHLPKKTKEPLTSFFQSLFEAFLMLTKGVITLLPLGVFAFTQSFVIQVSQNMGALKPILIYALCIVGANLIQGIVILPLLLKSKKIPVLPLARGMMPALLMAFFSKSSSATLPLSLQCAKEKVGLSERTSSFSFPLCSIINMNGCAAFILITILFVATSHQIVISPLEQILWIFLATFAAIGNAGVPMGCYFLTSAFIVSMQLPTYLLGIILPLYTLFDMLETSLNIWSDSCVTAIVDRSLQKDVSLQEASTQISARSIS